MTDHRLCALVLVACFAACVTPPTGGPQPTTQPVLPHAVDMTAILDHARDCRIQAEKYFDDSAAVPLTEAGLALPSDERHGWAYVYQHARTIEVIAARVAREAGLDERFLNMRIERLEGEVP